MAIRGVWFPIITPFKNGKVDFKSYEKLLKDALACGVHGVIPLGTTGESPTVTEEECIEIVKLTQKIVNKKVPIFVGCGGYDTAYIVKKAKTYKKLGVDGILSVVPYYNKPSQSGLIAHFTAIADATDLKVIVYNIPYRTGINMTNETLFTLAKHKNIVGVKDSCANYGQSMELLANKPANFSVFTGDDMMYYATITNGGDGGILASSHVQTADFVKIFDLVEANDHQAAFKIWRNLINLIPLLFKEPNPTPLKYILKKKGLIASDEVRLPLTTISTALQKEINKTLKLK
jgi:4-hydroxy-tetrahydrodipicolinate synthase